MTSTPSGMEEGPAAFRFDFDRFERMFELGILDGQGPRVELLEGRIVEMAPMSADHADVAAALIGALGVALRQDTKASGLRVSAGATLRIGRDSAPEPDVLVARRRAGEKYYDALDAALVVEVSISTRADDLRIKGPLYARAGVPELWIVEPETRQIRVLREPRSDGSWGHEIVVAEGAVTPMFSDRVRIDLSQLF